MVEPYCIFFPENFTIFIPLNIIPPNIPPPNAIPTNTPPL